MALHTASPDRRRARLALPWMRRPRGPVHASLVALVGGLSLAAAAATHFAPPTLLVPPAHAAAAATPPVAELGADAYPRAITVAGEPSVRLAAAPTRLVSQYWSADEYLYALAAPAAVVGVSDRAYDERSSNVLPWVRAYRPVIATDPEWVLRAHADLVLASDISRADGPALLRAAGLPVIRADTAIDTLDGIKAQMRTIAYLIGEDARGAAREAAFEGVIDRAARRRGTGAPPRVLALGSTYGFGAHTLLDDIFTRIGVENVAARHGLVGYARVSDEQILRWNPDWIVAGADAGRAGIRRAEFLSRPAVAATRAGQTGRILVVENPIFLPISPFTARLVDVLSSAFYGDRP